MLLRTLAVFMFLGIGFAPCAPITVQEPAKPKKYALLVGVNKYQHAAMNQPLPLQYAEADVTELAELLRASDYEVDLLTGPNATKKAISNAITKLKERGESDGVVLVALAGHGTQQEKEDDAYFCPYDTTMREAVRDGKRVMKNGQVVIEPDPASLVKLTDIVEGFRLSPAGTRILLADCCRNDPASGRGRGVGSGIRTDKLPANTAVLLSCSQGQQSWEDKRWGHGAFFYHVLQGLRDGNTTVTKLQSYLEESVPTAVKELGGSPEQDPHPLINGRRLDFGIEVLRTNSNYDLTGGYRFVHFGKGKTKVVLTFSDSTTKQYFARVYDLESGQPITPTMNHASVVNHAAFSPDGTRVIVSSFDGTARVYDADTGQPITPPLKHESVVTSATFSPDGTRVATVSSTARVWDVKTGQPVTLPLKNGGLVNHAAFSHDGTLLLTSGYDKSPTIYVVSTGQPMAIPSNHDDWVNYGTFSPDVTRFVTVSQDKSARIWEAKTGNPVSKPLQHEDAVFHVCFSPNGRLVVTSSFDRTARVWDVKTGNSITTLKHFNMVNHSTFSPDGRRIVTASADRTAQVWDAATGLAITPLLKHADNVSHAAFSPDGRKVVTLSRYRNATIWDARTGEELKKTTITAN